MSRVPFLLAAVLLCFLPACASLHQGDSFGKGEELQHERKYREAAEFYEEAAEKAPGTNRSAEALFTAARLRSAPDNPQKEYQRALQDIEELLRRYPNDAHAAEARTWRSFLKTIVELKKENERLQKNIEQLKKVDITHEERRRQ